MIAEGSKIMKDEIDEITHLVRLEKQLAECQKQRDSALEALKYLLDVFIDEYERNHPGWRCDGYDAVIVARKALALCDE